MSAPIVATAGMRIPVSIEHYDGTGASTVKLRWKTPTSGPYWPEVPITALAPN